MAAREAYQDPRTGQRIKPGTRLGDEYQVRSLPMVKRRLYQAGARLAMVLNKAFVPQASLSLIPKPRRQLVASSTSRATTRLGLGQVAVRHDLDRDPKGAE